MSLDTGIWICGLAAELLVIVLMLRRSITRLLPVFFGYLVWGLLTDLLGMFIRAYVPSAFFNWYRFQMLLDAGLQLVVLAELAWSVLRPYRRSLHRSTPLFLIAIVLCGGAVIWPMTGFTPLSYLPPAWHTLIRFQQMAAILRILFFLILAGLSQLLAIGWRSRELQVATGLGFYSIASLGAVLLHTQTSGAAHYQLIEQGASACYLISLAYWAFSFMQQEAPRQVFSPRMQNLLFAMAGTARDQRIALENTPKTRKH